MKNRNLSWRFNNKIQKAYKKGQVEEKYKEVLKTHYGTLYRNNYPLVHKYWIDTYSFIIGIWMLGLENQAWWINNQYM